MKSDVIRVSHLDFSYHSKAEPEKIKPLFSDFNLELPMKGITALSGPSGCGKTTLLRLICGLETPQTGMIEGITPDEIALLFQENRLLPWYSIRKNIELVLPRHRVGESKELLEQSYLSALSDSFPDQLSGGQQRCAAILRAIAFAKSKKLLCLDEPFNGLDLERRQRLSNMIRELNIPCLLVSHNPEDLALADRVLKLLNT